MCVPREKRNPQTPSRDVPRRNPAGGRPLYHSNMSSDRRPSVDDQTLRLRQILDSSPALIHTATPDGYLDFFNRTWCEFVGKPVEELYGWKWTSCVHPDDIGVLLEKWRESIVTGNPLGAEARVRRADGEFRRMLHQKIAQRDADGMIVGWHGTSVDIESHKQAENSLRKDVEELRTNKYLLAEAQRLGQMGSWSFDPATGFDHWSPELFQIHGLEPAPEAPTSEAYLALVHPEDREFMASLMDQMLVEPCGFDVTKRIVRPDGQLRFVRFVGSAGYETGSLKRIGVGVDVTEHELLTQELNRRQAYLTEALRLSQTGYFSWKPATGELLLSDEMYRIHEWDPATKVQMEAILDSVHPDDRSLVSEMAERTANGISINYRHRLLFPDGRIKFLRVIVRPLDNSDGNEVVGAVIDVTEANLAEEKIRLSERELRTLVEAIPAYVTTSLPDGTVDFLNQRWLDYTGLTREQAIVGAIHPDDF